MYLRPLRDTSRTVLVIGGDAELRQRTCSILAVRGYQAGDAADCAAARRQLDAQGADLLIVSALLPKSEALALKSALRRRQIGVPVIVLAEPAAWSGMSFLDIANLLEAAAVLQRPFQADALERLAASALAAASGEPTPVACFPGDFGWPESPIA